MIGGVSHIDIFVAYYEYFLMIVFVFSALMSLGLLLDGMYGLEPKWSSNNQPCYKYKVSKLLQHIYLMAFILIFGRYSHNLSIYFSTLSYSMVW